jgi:anti-sigma-K factor RskA
MKTDEQISLYAIGAMDAREAAAFEQLLKRSPDLRARVAEEQAAAAAMLTAVEPMAPSPAVKQRLMAQIGGAAPGQTLGQTLGQTPGQTPSAPTQPARAPAKEKAGVRDVWRWLFGGLSIAFAALALAFGVGLINTQSQMGQQMAQLQTQVAQLQTQAQAAQSEGQATGQRVSQLERELDSARAQADQAQQAASSAAASAEQARADAAVAQATAQALDQALAESRNELAVLSQANVRSATLLARTPQFDGGAVTVFFAPNSKSALITVANLPALTADLDYQVWLIKDGVALPSSVFDTAVTGDGRLIVTSDETFEAYESVGITVEPAGGRPTPNPDGPIFLGPLS